MSNPSVSFGKGLQSNLPNIANGQILIATDTGNLFFDQDDKRIQVNADKAVKDGNGKNIADTYELKGAADIALATAQAYVDKQLNNYTPKHDTEENWAKIAADFIPKRGEIILYDIDSNFDYERIKIGDGITTLANLQFYLASELEKIQEQIGLLNQYALDVDVNDNDVLTFTRPLAQ